MPASSLNVTLNTHLNENQVTRAYVRQVVATHFNRLAVLQRLLTFRRPPRGGARVGADNAREGRLTAVPASLRARILSLGVEVSRRGLVHAHWSMTLEWDSDDLLVLSDRRHAVSINSAFQSFFDQYFPVATYARVSLTTGSRYQNYAERAEKEGRIGGLPARTVQISRRHLPPEARAQLAQNDA
jgi:hypothetical protein